MSEEIEKFLAALDSNTPQTNSVESVVRALNLEDDYEFCEDNITIEEFDAE